MGGGGFRYGKPFGAGDTLTAVRHVARSHAAPFPLQETLELLVNGKSQGAVKMPALLPADAVGCVSTCTGSAHVTAVAPAAFNVSKARVWTAVL